MPLQLQTGLSEAPQNAVSARAWAVLNHLRFVAMGCRVKRYTTLFKACALLQADKSASLSAHADALMRCLNEALGKPARLMAPGSAELSFDEAWLVQLSEAFARGDEASQTFLLNSRVAREHRRLIGFLMGQITKNFSLD
ncbi:hypothetical protein [Primorskyibacter sp. S187A]|uniref:hypothetical protein n=1 Tax=Primorskyibacter sp. S187A TaxID=3415130 RepID=UPI003C7D9CBC